MKGWIWRWSPAALMMVLIFIASATPGLELPEFGVWDVFVKKGGHIFVYALLAAAYRHALDKTEGIARVQFAIALCLTILYAASDEWHQNFTPGRAPSFWDVGIDAAGGILGLGTWSLIRKHFKDAHTTANS